MNGMQTAIVATGVALVAAGGFAAELRVSTEDALWQDRTAKVEYAPAAGAADVTLDMTRTDQTMLGFGTALSELGYDALALLPDAERKAFLDEMFGTEGGAFTVIRLPIGSSDFARSYYSYDDHPGDFDLAKFSIARDEFGLLPLVREVQRRVPADMLRVWGSPWTPPAWMKVSGHYACVPSKYSDLREEQKAKGDWFRMEDAYLKAYASYFRRYVDAYREAGVPIWMVMPQNEFQAETPYSSCAWKNESLATFVGKYLGPALEGSGTEIYYGTIHNPGDAVTDVPMADPAAAKYIRGMGFQWAGRWALDHARKAYPHLAMIQSEQECGNGRNDWAFALHAWELMQFYLSRGCVAYDYWNVALKEGEPSPWGWHQNSLVCVDARNGKGRLTNDYYALKHLSHYVRRGAVRLVTGGAYADVLAFANPDGTLVVALGNRKQQPQQVNVSVGDRTLSVDLPAESIATLTFRADEKPAAAVEGKPAPAAQTALPKDFVRLPWIKSTSTQWIDTGYARRMGTEITCEVEISKDSPNRFCAVFGGGGWIGDRSMRLWARFNWKFGASYDFNGPDWSALDKQADENPDLPYDEKVRIVCNRKGASWKSATKEGSLAVAGGDANEGSATLYIFNTHTAGKGAEDNGVNMKLYSFRIVEGGVPKRDFVPCQRPDGICGLWDLVEGKFHGNVGSGYFVAPCP